MTQRKILTNSLEFKQFWKNKGPFSYALTSMDFPPVMLAPEEWIFSNDIVALLKEFMQFDQRKMKFIAARFNPAKKKVLRPEKMIPWKINNFPEEWNRYDADFFMPGGHLTDQIVTRLSSDIENADASDIESAFFLSLESAVQQVGCLLFKPQHDAVAAARMKKYLEEWEADDLDAGLL